MSTTYFYLLEFTISAKGGELVGCLMYEIENKVKRQVASHCVIENFASNDTHIPRALHIEPRQVTRVSQAFLERMVGSEHDTTISFGGICVAKHRAPPPFEGGRTCCGTARPCALNPRISFRWSGAGGVHALVRVIADAAAAPARERSR